MSERFTRMGKIDEVQAECICIDRFMKNFWGEFYLCSFKNIENGGNTTLLFHYCSPQKINKTFHFIRLLQLEAHDCESVVFIGQTSILPDNFN